MKKYKLQDLEITAGLASFNTSNSKYLVSQNASLSEISTKFFIKADLKIRFSANISTTELFFPVIADLGIGLKSDNFALFKAARF